MSSLPEYVKKDGSTVSKDDIEKYYDTGNFYYKKVYNDNITGKTRHKYKHDPSNDEGYDMGVVYYRLWPLSRMSKDDFNLLPERLQQYYKPTYDGKYIYSPTESTGFISTRLAWKVPASVSERTRQEASSNGELLTKLQELETERSNMKGFNMRTYGNPVDPFGKIAKLDDEIAKLKKSLGYSLAGKKQKQTRKPKNKKTKKSRRKSKRKTHSKN